jgi:tetratricopeptide (TPR) repeat protein
MRRRCLTSLPYAFAIGALVLAAACARKAPPPLVPSAPKYPDFVFPAVTDPALSALGEQQRTAWAYLQSGDLRSAERTFGTVVRLRSGLVPGESGLGYVALARKQAPDALQHFERALQAEPAYAPALAGRGVAPAAAGRDTDALASYEAAMKADPSLDLGPRIEVLRFRGAGDAVRQARRAAEQGHLDEARRAYTSAIEASPDSAFLYRELAVVESKAGSDDQAIEHLRKAVSLDPSDARAAVLLGDALARLNRFDEAAKAYESAQAIEPSPETDRKLEDARRRAEMSRLPPEFQAIPAAPEVTRGDVAAVIGVRLGGVLPPAGGRPGALVTDIRGHWASAWILDVVRAGIMDPLPNHTFQPRQRVRRADFAGTVSRLLALAATRKPAAAADWRSARVKIADVPPTHPAYPAISQAAASGVLPLAPGDTFQPARPLSGRDLVDAISRLEAMLGPIPRRR